MNGGARRGWSAALVAAALLGPADGVAQARVVVVSGLGGEPAYEERFRRWGATIAEAARAVPGARAEDVVFLAEDPDAAGPAADGRSTLEGVEKAFQALAERPGGAPLLVVLIGHGSADARGARVNLPGPDLTATVLDALLKASGGDPVAVVVASSSSGAFLEPLAHAGRIVVTATRAGGERQATRFAAHFAEAFAGGAADTDKDGRVSLLEAFRYAEAEVERSFASAGQLQTEHPVLDDDGDGAAGDRDGEVAARFFLGSASGADDDAAELVSATGALRELLEERARIESELEALKARKEGVDADAYDQALEALFVRLALNARALRAERGGSP
ncbi:MAG TPA: hypothetical protein VML95_05235 [Longimicrobiales bacterium]|nr:hypothetical protein [Longimicrobiales bacterium]